jgi:hypothetical protein
LIFRVKAESGAVVTRMQISLTLAMKPEEDFHKGIGVINNWGEEKSSKL